MHFCASKNEKKTIKSLKGSSFYNLSYPLSCLIKLTVYAKMSAKSVNVIAFLIRFAYTVPVIVSTVTPGVVVIAPVVGSAV